MNTHTHTCDRPSSPAGSASPGASVASVLGTHSSAQSRQEEPGAANSPAAPVAGAFQRRLTKIWLPARNTRKANEARCQPVAAHGWEWPSQRHAARALGVTDTNVTRTLKCGTFGDLVLRRLGVKP